MIPLQHAELRIERREPLDLDHPEAATGAPLQACHESQEAAPAALDRRCEADAMPPRVARA